MIHDTLTGYHTSRDGGALRLLAVFHERVISSPFSTSFSSSFFFLLDLLTSCRYVCWTSSPTYVSRTAISAFASVSIAFSLQPSFHLLLAIFPRKRYRIGQETCLYTRTCDGTAMNVANLLRRKVAKRCVS